MMKSKANQGNIQALIPPIGYSMLDEGLHRCVGPLSSHNVTFLHQFDLKSVLLFTDNGYLDSNTRNLLSELHVDVISSNFPNIHEIILIECEKWCWNVAQIMLSKEPYPILILTSANNFNDLLVLSFLRRLQQINLFSIYYELQLHSMKKLVDMEQFIEQIDIRKYSDEYHKIIDGQYSSSSVCLPGYMKLHPCVTNGKLSLPIETTENVISSVSNEGNSSSTVCSVEESALELLIKSILSNTCTEGDGVNKLVISSHSTYDPMISLVDDKDEDD